MAALANIKITHQLPGRLRIEIPELHRNPFLCRRIEQLFTAQAGVREAKANSLTGRLLITFYQDQLSPASMHSMLQKLVTSFKTGNGPMQRADHEQKKAVPPIDALPHYHARDQDNYSPLLQSQILHVGITGTLLAALLAKRFIYGRSSLSASPLLFNLTAAMTIISGYPVLRHGIAHLTQKGRVDHNLIISIATLILLAMRENITSMSILWILNLSSLFRMMMLEYSRQSIRRMIAGQQRHAWVMDAQGQKQKVIIHKLRPGDEVIVHAGERVPVDGTIKLGTVRVNQAALTGEALPTIKKMGDALYAGSIIETGVVHVIAQQVGMNTSVARMLRFVRQAEHSKAPIAGIADRYAQRLVPIILGLTGLVYFLTRDFQRTLAMLIIGCPAAVILSTQTALGMAVGKAASEGMLVKHTGALEEIAQIDTILFDKTGTLTVSQPQITEIVPIVKNLSAEEVLTLAASADAHTHHPLARMLVHEAEKHGLTLLAAESEMSLGLGVRAIIEGAEILVGNEDLMQAENIDLRRAKANALRLQHLGSGVIYVARNKNIIGLIGLREAVRTETGQAMDMLRYEGVEHIGLITGDTSYSANNVAQQLGITASWSGCLPAAKVAVIEKLQKEGHRVAMIGDGINDSPALAAANVGVAMGGNGTDAAMETADIVFNGDDPRNIARLMHLGKKTLEIVRQNLSISVGLNVIGIALGAARLITPVTAALIQNFSTLAVVVNSARILKKHQKANQVPSLDLQTFARPLKTLSASSRSLPVHKVHNLLKTPHQNAKWHMLKLEEICQIHHAHAKLGLHGHEIDHRLAIHGRNKLQEAKRKSFWWVFFDQFKDVMVQVLLGVCGVSVLLGQLKNALLTGAIVLANALLGAIQEKRAEKSMEALHKLAAPTARVIREGRTLQVKAENLVPGDVVLLEAGDRVPADCRIIEAVNLEVEESSLTGENLPVRKHADVIEEASIPLGDKKNMVFMGTIVIRGRAKAMIVATGMATEMGHVAGMMQETQFEQTPLQKRLEELGKYLLYGCLGIAGLIFTVGVLRGEPTMNMLQTAVSLAVAAIPEGLTAIVLIALAMGVQRMARKNIIVRRMASIETLGCTTVICSDKTGTITKNEMTVRTLYLDGQWYKFSGEGYAPSGEVTLDEQPVKIGACEGLRRALMVGVLCNNALLNKAKQQRLQSEAETNTKLARKQIAWTITGDPTEGALLVAGAKAGLWAKELQKQHPRLREIPFEAERRMMSVMVDRNEDEITVFTKGASDTILERCTHKLTAQGDTIPLDDEERHRIFEANDTMTNQAMRVLALAFRRMSAHELDASKAEEELVFAGLIGMIDPPRPEVIAAVQKCRQAGVKVVMITGDHPKTAAAIARETGILQAGGEVLTGGELDTMSDMDLIDIVEKIAVYARTSPQHKLRIIRALKSKDYIVAMTGDGVNDGPAVKAADVGIAMGITGTDVTKEAAAMTLTDDNFATIVTAMEEGRSIYNNIRKAIRYLLATNIGEVVLMFLAVLLGLPLPLLPIQLLWINLVGDGLPAIALVNDPPSPHIMSQPPRSGDESVFAGGLGKKIMSRGLAIGVGTLALYAWKLASGGVMAARTLALTSLCIGQFIHIFDCRNEQFAGKVGFFSNRFLLGAVALSMVMVAGAIHLPFCQSLFQTVALGPLDWGIATAGAILTAGLDIIFERFILSRRSAFPLPRPMTCQELVQ